MTHPAYDQMVAAAEKLGLPLSYKTDLTVHDRQWLEKYPDLAAFGWMIYRSGTHFIPKPAGSNRLEAAVAAVQSITNSTWMDGYMFRYENGVLTPEPSAKDFLLWFVDGDRSRWEHRFELQPCPYCGHQVPTTAAYSTHAKIYICPDCRQICILDKQLFKAEPKPLWEGSTGVYYTRVQA